MEGGSQSTKNCIFVGGVPYNADSTVVMNYFKQFGKVIKVKLNKTRNGTRDDTGIKASASHRGCGFIEMESREGLAKVLSAPEHIVMGHKLDCRLAMTNRERKAYHQSLNQDRRKIFIGKLPKSITKEQIETFFSSMVEIEETTLIKKDKKDFAICFLLLKDKYSGDLLAGKTFEIGPEITVECQIALFPQQLHQRKAAEGLLTDMGSRQGHSVDCGDGQFDDDFMYFEFEGHTTEQEKRKSAPDNDTKYANQEITGPKLVPDLDRSSNSKCASETSGPKHQDTTMIRNSKKTSLDNTQAPKMKNCTNSPRNWHPQLVDDSHLKLPSSTSTLDVASVPEEPLFHQRTIQTAQPRQAQVVQNIRRSRKDREAPEKIPRNSSSATWAPAGLQHQGNMHSCRDSGQPLLHQPQPERVDGWPNTKFGQNWNWALSNSQRGQEATSVYQSADDATSYHYRDMLASRNNPWGTLLYSEPYGTHNSNQVHTLSFSPNSVQPQPFESSRSPASAYQGFGAGHFGGSSLHSEQAYFPIPTEYHLGSHQNKQYNGWSAAPNPVNSGPSSNDEGVLLDLNAQGKFQRSGLPHTVGRQSGNGRVSKPAAGKTNGYSPFRF